MGKTVVITAGGTSEPIDKVRKITNSSSGKLGAIIADMFASDSMVDKIIYIHSRKAVLPKPNDKIELVMADSTMQVLKAVEDALKNPVFMFIHSMAISDYMVDAVSTIEMIAKDVSHCEMNEKNIADTIRKCESRLDNSSKLSSYAENMVVILKQTPKIIGKIKELQPETILIGFKLLENVDDETLIEVAGKLLEKNKCDFVVANDITSISALRHNAIVVDERKCCSHCQTKEEIASCLHTIFQQKI